MYTISSLTLYLALCWHQCHYSGWPSLMYLNWTNSCWVKIHHGKMFWSVCGSKASSQAVALDYYQRNQLPIIRSELQGVGVRPPRGTGRTMPPTPPTSLPCVFLCVHVSTPLCRSNLKYSLERWVVFWWFQPLLTSKAPPDIQSHPYSSPPRLWTNNCSSRSS